MACLREDKGHRTKQHRDPEVARVECLTRKDCECCEEEELGRADPANRRRRRGVRARVRVLIHAERGDVPKHDEAGQPSTAQAS